VLLSCGSQKPGGSPDPATPEQEIAELVLVGGDILTMNIERPRASAVAVSQGRFLFVGSNEGARAHVGPNTRVIELEGRTVTPGLVDAHCHLYGLGKALDSVDLRASASAAEAAKRAAKFAADLPEGAWVTGRGWDQNLWTEKEFPTAAELDAVLASRPVALRRVDGHALWANSVALKIAGVTAATREVSGGKIVRDTKGVPTGVFVDSAMSLVESKIPAANESLIERRILLAIDAAVAAGITEVHEMGISDETLAVYQRLEAEGRLPLRVYAVLAGELSDALELDKREKIIDDSGKRHLTVRAMKLFADGALGSRGAALLQPYSDKPEERGLWVTSPEDLTRAAEAAAAAGWQLAVHAIGDAANRAVLDAFETALAERPGDHRFRVEHAQVLAPADLPRFAKLGVLASMQPTHATSDMPWAGERLGEERIVGAYAWRSLLDSGAHVPFGSDFPVEKVPPLLGVYAAVTRADEAGSPEGGWTPNERISLEEALAGFTREAAYAGFAEGQRGQIRTGYAADLTVYDRGLTPDRSILSTEISVTMVAGEPVFERASTP